MSWVQGNGLVVAAGWQLTMQNCDGSMQACMHTQGNKWLARLDKNLNAGFMEANFP